MSRRNFWTGRATATNLKTGETRTAEVDFPGLDNLHPVAKKTNRHNEVGADVEFKASGDYQSVSVRVSAKLAVDDDDFFDGGAHEHLIEVCAERALTWIEGLEQGWIPEYALPERMGFPQLEDEDAD